ncbi:hypothetical protein FB446DRAFT_81217 [Lentinula raphanica]|nr:hypothetical protein FB446DRAFT_81217 [Lentinula raphanica]
MFSYLLSISIPSLVLSSSKLRVLPSAILAALTLALCTTSLSGYLFWSFAQCSCGVYDNLCYYYERTYEIASGCIILISWPNGVLIALVKTELKIYTARYPIGKNEIALDSITIIMPDNSTRTMIITLQWFSNRCPLGLQPWILRISRLPSAFLLIS